MATPRELLLIARGRASLQATSEEDQRAIQQTDPMEIDKLKEADENIAAVQAYEAKEKANQLIPVEGKKSNKQTHAREIKSNNISSNPYDSLDTSGVDDEEMSTVKTHLLIAIQPATLMLPWRMWKDLLEYLPPRQRKLMGILRVTV